MPSPSASPVAGTPSAHRPGARWLIASTLLLIVVASGAARLVTLDRALVWHDETFSLARVFGHDQEQIWSSLFSGRLLTPTDVLRFQRPSLEHGWSDTLKALSSHPEHAPLYYSLARLATDLPVSPVTAMRGVSAVCSLLLLPMIFWLMRELFGRGAVPWVAATLIACSPMELLYAQEARQYALWLLLFTASTAALARAMRRNSSSAWWAYGLLMTLGAYTHLLFLLTLPIHAVYGLSRLRASDRDGFAPRELIARWLAAIGAAAVAFTPWVLVILTRQDQMRTYTAWMDYPIGTLSSLTAWAAHLIEAFVDLRARPEPHWLVLLIPLVWTMLSFVRHAPRPAVWLLLTTITAYAAITLGPDLLIGGSRSLQTRYALPALLAIQLIVAWWIGSALAQETRSLPFRVAASALLGLTLLGLLSQIAILQAETWSTKGFSAHNVEVARRANAGGRTLILASYSSIATGELISVSYHLDSNVEIWGEPRDRNATAPLNADTIIALTPSEALRAQIEQNGKLVPLANSWQWLELVPRPTASTNIPDQ